MEEVTGGAPDEGNTDEATEVAAVEPDVASLTIEDLATLDDDFNGVDAALQRLADGSYWTDEVTGEPLPAAVLEASPVARRA